jgi:chaperonin GroEL
MQAAVAQMVQALRASALPADGSTLADTAARAAHDRELGDAVASAIEGFGESGVLIEKGGTKPVEVEVRQGLRLDRGAVSPFFLGDEGRTRSTLQNCYVLAVDGKISQAAELAPLLAKVAEAGRPLLVVANEFDADGLALLTVNRINHKVDVVAVTSPGFGQPRTQLLNDVAIVTGGLVVGDGTGVRMERLTLAELGRATEVTVTRRSTTIVGGGGGRPEALRSRAGLARTEFEEAGSVLEREDTARRRAELSGCRFAAVLVGGSTDVERDERLRRAEDGRRAAQAAQRGGVVAGGGVSLARAGSGVALADMPSSWTLGATIVKRAASDPLATIAANAGAEGPAVVATILAAEPSTGFDAETLTYMDFRKAGIVDAAEVVCVALESALYISRRALLSAAVVAQPLSGDRLPETAEHGGPANLPMP